MRVNGGDLISIIPWAGVREEAFLFGFNVAEENY